jgi:hypothetical protein
VSETAVRNSLALPALLPQAIQARKPEKNDALVALLAANRVGVSFVHGRPTQMRSGSIPLRRPRTLRASFVNSA